MPDYAVTIHTGGTVKNGFSSLYTDWVFHDSRAETR